MISILRHPSQNKRRFRATTAQTILFWTNNIFFCLRSVRTTHLVNSPRLWLCNSVDRTWLSRLTSYSFNITPVGVWNVWHVDNTIRWAHGAGCRWAATLLPMIQRVVEPGSISHSNQWVAYCQLHQDVNYTYMLLCQPQHEFRQSIYWGPHPSHRELLGKDEAEIQNGEGCVFGTAAELFRQHDVVQHFFVEIWLICINTSVHTSLRYIDFEASFTNQAVLFRAIRGRVTITDLW